MKDELKKRLSALSADQLQLLKQKFAHIQEEKVNVAQSQDMDDCVAVIGMAFRFPGDSNDIDSFWQMLSHNQDVVGKVPEGRPGESALTWPAGYIQDIEKFDAQFFNISPREAELMDPQQRLLLQVIWHTLEDAGYEASTLAGSATGVYIGVSGQDYRDLLIENSVDEAFFATGTSQALMSNRISYWFDLRGPSETIDTACSSSLVALHQAVCAIKAGQCEQALVGTANLLISPHLFRSFEKAGMLSPDGRCKTFDEKANGYVRGEGVAALMLKSVKKAKQDGDQIYGVILGTGVNHGGKSNSLTAPNLLSQTALLNSIYETAGVSPTTINYIEAHGTGTSLGDPIEVEALTDFFLQLQKKEGSQVRYQQCGLGSVKTNIGHLEASAGIAGVIKVLLAMRYHLLPGNPHFNLLNPHIQLENSPFYIVRKNSEWVGLKDEQDKNSERRAGVSAFGFGGTNAHVILQEWPTIVSKPIENQKPYYLIALSANHPDALLSRIKDLSNSIKKNSDMSLQSLAYTLNVCRAHFDYRCSFIVSSTEKLLNLLDEKKVVSQRRIVADEQSLNEKEMNALLETLYEQRFNTENYRERLIQIEKLYLNGQRVDWRKLHKNEEKKRIFTLPKYPFIKERFWFQKKLLAIKSIDYVKKTHYVLGKSDNLKKISGNTYCHCFRLNATENILLQHHHLFDKPVLPMDSLIELIYAMHVHCFNLKPLIIEKLFALTPLVFGNETELCIEQTFTVKDGKTQVVLSSCLGQSQELKYEHMRCYLGVEEVIRPTINVKMAQVDHSWVVIEEERFFNSHHAVKIGPFFQSFQKVFIKDHYAICQLHLSKTASEYKKEFYLHPGILDGAFGVVFILADYLSPGNSDGSEIYIPSYIEKMVVWDELHEDSYVVVVEHVQDHSAFQRFNIYLLNQADEVVISIFGVDEKKINLSTFKNMYFLEKNNASQNESTLPANKKNVSQSNESVLAVLSKIVSDILMLDESKLLMDKGLAEQGLDSILGMEVVNKINQKLALSLKTTIVYEQPTLKKLADYLIKTYSQLRIDNVAPVDNKREITQPLISENVYQEDDIAIIGMSGKFPGSNTLEELWDHLAHGNYLLESVPKDHWDYQPYYQPGEYVKGKIYSKQGGFISDVDQFDPLFFNISPREAELMDPQLRLLLQVTWAALEEAGYAERISGTKTGVYVASCFNDYAELLKKTPDIDYQFAGINNGNSSLANRMSYFFNLTGPSMMVDTACSASLVALHLACQSLKLGECQYAIASGVNLSLSEHKYLTFCSMNAFSRSDQLNPFDESADGYLPGEGIASLLLKPLAKAMTDSDLILGVIKGSAVNAAGMASGPTVPNPEQETQVMIEAWTKSNINPETISYFEAHGTGTKVGDPLEVNAIKKAFSTFTEKKQFCALGTIKSNIGHTEATAGIAGVIKLLLQMRHQCIPVMPKLKKINPLIDLTDSAIFINRELQAWIPQAGQPRRGVVSSFGMGGTYAHVVIEELPSIKSSLVSSKPYYLVALSAKHVDSLKQRIKDLQLYFIKNKSKQFPLENVAYTLNTGCSHLEYRCAFVVSSIEQLGFALEKVIRDHPCEEYFIMQKDKITTGIPRSDFLLNKLRDTSIINSSYRDILHSLANAYIEGSNIDWAILHENEAKQRITMPTYPFLKKRYWFDRYLQNKQSIELNTKKMQLKMTNQHQSILEKEKIQSDNKISLKILTKQLPFNNVEVREQEIKVMDAPEPIEKKNPVEIKIFLNEMISKLLYLTDEIDEEKVFSSYGIDSILGVEIINKINSRYDIQLSAAKLYDYPTINSLSAYLSLLPAIQVKQKNNDDTQSRQDKKIIEKEDEINVGSENQSDAIAIVGMAGVFPGADNITAFWENLKSAQCSVTEIAKLRWSIDEFFSQNPNEKNKSYSKWGGFLDAIDCFDPMFFEITPAEAELMDPQQRLFLQTSWHALENAGYTKGMNGKRCGVYVGVMGNDYKGLLQGIDGALAAHKLVGNSNAILAARIAYFLDLKGPTLSVDTACSSSLVAIHLACAALQRNEVDMMIAGGVILYLSSDPYIEMCKAGMLSKDGSSKVFDSGANGFVPGEGCGALVLKRLSDAIKANDRIYGVIKGSAINQDGKTNGIIAPSAESQKALGLSIYERYKINPADISYVEAHAVGSKLGDSLEVEALTDNFSKYTNKKQYCAISSVKSNVGHTSAASGVISMIKVLLSMQHKQLVPSIQYQNSNEHIDFEKSPFYVNTELKPWNNIDNKPRLALVNSFGFSGTNAQVIIEEPTERNLPNDKSAKPFYLVTLSAKHPDSLKQRICDLHEYIQHRHDLPLSIIAYNLNVRQCHFKYRCAFVVASLDDLQMLLITAQQKEKLQCYFIRDQENIKTFETLKTQSIDELQDEIKNGNYLPDHYKNKLCELADSYLKGHDIDWQKIDGTKEIISLPPYPFIKGRYWVPESSMAATQQIVNKSSVINQDLLNLKNYLVNLFISLTKISAEYVDSSRLIESYGVDSIMLVTFHERLAQNFPRLSKLALFECRTLDSLANHLVKNFKDQVDELCEQDHASGATQNEYLNIMEQVDFDDIAIIGIDGQFPQAKNLEDFWTNLKNGKSSLERFPKNRLNQFESSEFFGGFIEDIDQFDAEFFNILPEEAEMMCPELRLLLQTTWRILENANYTCQGLDDYQQQMNKGIGVFVANMYQQYGFVAREFETAVDLSIYSPALIANRISHYFNLRGPSITLDAACAGSLTAIHMACESIRRGESIMAIAAGTNCHLHPAKFKKLSEMGIISDQKISQGLGQGDGYIPGEGIGAVLLKPLSLAIQDGDLIYGVIKTSVISHGGTTNTLTLPSASVQSSSIINMLKQKKIPIHSIGYVECAANGSQLSDALEFLGLKEAFSYFTDEKNFCALGTVKSNIGHLEAASGISQLFKVICQLNEKIFIPSINSDPLNSDIDINNSAFFIPKNLLPWKCLTNLQPENPQEYPRRALISSFGAGGSNAHLLLEEYIAAPSFSNDVLDAKPQLFVFSAKSKFSLLQRISDIINFLDKEIHYSLESIALTLQICRESMLWRVVILATTKESLRASLASYLMHRDDSSNQQTLWSNVAYDGELMKPFSPPFYLSLHNLMDHSESALREIASKWIQGANVVWKDLYPNLFFQKTRLPVYQFDKKTFWLGKTHYSTFLESEYQEVKNSELTAVENKLVELIQSMMQLSKSDISSTKLLSEYGFDSLRGMRLLNRINHYYKISLKPETVVNNPTIESLALLVHRNLKLLLMGVKEDCSQWSEKSDPLSSNDSVPDFIDRLSIPVTSTQTELHDEALFIKMLEVGVGLWKIDNLMTIEFSNENSVFKKEFDKLKLSADSIANCLTENLRYYPLSCSQKMMCVQSEMYKNNAYQLVIPFILSERVKFEKLKDSLDVVVNRHQILRTTFPKINNIWVQVVHPAMKVEMELIKISCSAELKNTKIGDILRKEKEHHFSLLNGPLFRLKLVECDGDDQIIILNIHHAICDGVSVSFLINELLDIYKVLRKNVNSDLPYPKAHYSHFVLSQLAVEPKKMLNEVAWWRQQLKNAPSHTKLPYDFENNLKTKKSGAVSFIVFDEKNTQNINTFCRREGISLNILVLTGLYLFLKDWTGENDILIGTILNQRNKLEYENLIGDFTNLVPLRFQQGSSLKGKAIFKFIKETFIEAYAHQDIAFNQLIQHISQSRNSSNLPFYNIFLDSLNFSAFESSTKLSAKSDLFSYADILSDNVSPIMDLFFLLTEESKTFSLSCIYRSDLFKKTTVVSLLENIKKIIFSLIDDPESLSFSAIKASNAIQQKLFCLPGGDGGHQIFKHLVKRNDDFEPYAIKYKNNIEPHNAIMEISKDAIKVSKCVNAAQPFSLLGLSYGGLIAFEVCQQLINLGNVKPKNLILLDPPPPVIDLMSKQNLTSILNVDFNILSLLLTMNWAVKGFGNEGIEILPEEIFLKSVESMSEYEKQKYAYHWIKTNTTMMLPLLDDFISLTNTLTKNILSVKDYLAKPLLIEDVKVTFIMPENLANPLGLLLPNTFTAYDLDKKEVWSKLFPNSEINFFTIDNSDHYSMFSSKNFGIISEKITELMS